MSFSKVLLVSLLVLIVSVFSPRAFGAMSSGNYVIQSDSINFGGGSSSSTGYSLQDTLGEVATGDSSSTNYMMHAGYQQMQQSYISIAASGNPALPNVGGVSGGSSVSTSSWTVTTDDSAGYTLSVQATSSPAMQGSLGAVVSDYAPGSPGTPDYQFTITASQSAFGFSPEGTDITQLYKDNGSACNTGSLDTQSRCWNGFTTTPQIVAKSGSSTSPTGTMTTVRYQVQIGSAKIQDAESYSATIIATAVSL